MDWGWCYAWWRTMQAGRLCHNEENVSYLDAVRKKCHNLTFYFSFNNIGFLP